MGYRRHYDYPDNPGTRIGHVTAVAGFWGMGGWIVGAIVGGADGVWGVYIGGFLLIFLVGHFYIWGAPVQNQGTEAEMLADPDLNTQDFQLHWKRLEMFGHSKYNGETEYMGPRGGVYKYTASGHKNYR
ncbi:hypothetical protein [Synechococcus sp. WH 8016]|uniref:hypothetical protein n=1 Tax=Synechococcus sp. WH 8016 TaxID=166318 RepID=UPI00022D9EC5|nr:hypothetical protein [Synechococcus sp. WH 8016]EHA60525.1 hypothetical protein Syn8016DRAFT_2312 [Synechococcus sp. WH 8016]